MTDYIDEECHCCGGTAAWPVSGMLNTTGEDAATAVLEVPAVVRAGDIV